MQSFRMYQSMVQTSSSSSSSLFNNKNMFSHEQLSIQAKYITLCIVLVSFALAADQLIQIQKQLSSSSKNILISIWKNNYSIALVDNLTHGIIGSISWIMISVSKGALINEYSIIFQSIICFLVSSLIDLDHVVVAKSFDLRVK